MFVEQNKRSYPREHTFYYAPVHETSCTVLEVEYDLALVKGSTSYQKYSRNASYFSSSFLSIAAVCHPESGAIATKRRALVYCSIQGTRADMIGTQSREHIARGATHQHEDMKHDTYHRCREKSRHLYSSYFTRPKSAAETWTTFSTAVFQLCSLRVLVCQPLHSRLYYM